MDYSGVASDEISTWSTPSFHGYVHKLGTDDDWFFEPSEPEFNATSDGESR